MIRAEKIKLLKAKLKGEAIDFTALYMPDSCFIKCGEHYFNDGYRWTAEEFEALQQKLVTPKWIPELWFIESKAPNFYEWLMNHCKPISERIPGVMEQCTIEFDTKCRELFGEGSDELYIY
jgi:hypothetical protein